MSELNHDQKELARQLARCKALQNFFINIAPSVKLEDALEMVRKEKGEVRVFAIYEDFTYAELCQEINEFVSDEENWFVVLLEENEKLIRANLSS